MQPHPFACGSKTPFRCAALRVCFSIHQCSGSDRCVHDSMRLHVNIPGNMDDMTKRGSGASVSVDGTTASSADRAAYSSGKALVRKRRTCVSTGMARPTCSTCRGPGTGQATSGSTLPLYEVYPLLSTGTPWALVHCFPSGDVCVVRTFVAITLTVLQLGHFDEWSHARWKQGRQNLHNEKTHRKLATGQS